VVRKVHRYAVGSRARKAERRRSFVIRESNFPAVNDKMLDAGIGYVQVETLTKGKALEAANKIKALQRRREKLILDRATPGRRSGRRRRAG